MTSRAKLPDKLSTYPKEYFAIIPWARDQLTVSKAVYLPPSGAFSKSEAHRLRFRLNSLRKSLEFWAPNSDLTLMSQELVFLLAECFEGAHTGQWYIKIEGKSFEKLVEWHKIPGFEDIVTELEIPKPELDEIEIDRRNAGAAGATDFPVDDQLPPDETGTDPMPAVGSADYLDQALSLTKKDEEQT